MDKNYKSAEELLEEAATKYANEINKRPDGSINVIRADISYDDFKEGAKWYASQFQHEAETVYVWVKADKELPEENGDVHFIRMFEPDGSILPRLAWFHNNEFSWMQHNGEVKIFPVLRTEWLKEVPLSSIKGGDERINEILRTTGNAQDRIIKQLDKAENNSKDLVNWFGSGFKQVGTLEWECLSKEYCENYNLQFNEYYPTEFLIKVYLENVSSSIKQKDSIK